MLRRACGLAGLPEHGRGCWPRPRPWRLPLAPLRPRHRSRTAGRVTITLPEIGVNAAPAVTSGYATQRTSTATKTDTPLRDVPQASPSSPSRPIDDQLTQNMADVVRYVPGVGMRRARAIATRRCSAASTTSDFFVDGVRDDVQYFRDLYNVERVEALKGPTR